MGFSMRFADKEKLFIVVKVEENSLAAGALEVGDIIMDVDGQISYNKHHLQRWITEALKKNGVTSIGIKRAMSKNTLNFIR